MIDAFQAAAPGRRKQAGRHALTGFIEAAPVPGIHGGYTLANLPVERMVWMAFLPGIQACPVQG
nr:hypothetical protein [Stenotrophomonas maltophilia]